MASSELHSRNTETGAGQVICPKCGEVNSSNFLFCGMCGTILEPARRATAATSPPAARVTESQVSANHPVNVQVASPSPVTPRAAVDAGFGKDHPVPAISGPSLLGLDQSNVDDIRERAFSGLASYGRPEEPKSAGKEILLTVLLIVALAAAGWWTYKNYIRVVGLPKPTPAAGPPSEAVNAPADNPAPQSTEKSSAKDASAERSQEGANAAAGNTEAAKPPEATPPAAETSKATEETKKETETEPESTAKATTPAPTAARHEVSATRIPTSKPAPSAADSGDALFRRGETYLYGRNGAQDCSNAIKYLKMASDQQHAKARSMMGTMYATGHCVPRDLPSSYRWFALALQADPNNNVLEKNLRAVWNQMTPPERQMATKRQ
jgi:Sel1 repeat-containing protein